MDQFDLVSLKNKLKAEGEIPIKIVSDSMVPCLKVNDTVKVLPLSKPLKPFDLIVYYRNNQFVCHYVWRNQIDFNNTIVTRSLKNPKSDEPPHPISYVLGQVMDRRISIFMKVKIFLLNLLSNSL